MRKFLLVATAAFLVLCLDSTDSPAQALNLGNWFVNSTPAVSTQASASKAASAAGKVHVATSCSGSISTVAAQTNITLALRDGATGAGTVMWSKTIICAITTPCVLDSGILNLPGTASTAMTCEWSGVPVTNNFAVATLTGYDAG